MKKGCFIKSIVILTIFTAIVIYIVQNKFDDFILKPAKELLAESIIDDWSKEIEFVKESEQKDSLKIIVNDFLSTIENKEMLFDDRFKSFMSYVSSVVEDSIIESSELNFISEKIKTELQNERSTQN